VRLPHLLTTGAKEKDLMNFGKGTRALKTRGEGPTIPIHPKKSKERRRNVTKSSCRRRQTNTGRNTARGETK